MQAQTTQGFAARDRILDAAEQLVRDHGARNLTLDAVAQAAGVSKGGLLYHFPGKDALLAGMVERHVDELNARCLAERAQLPAACASTELKSWMVVRLRASAGIGHFPDLARAVKSGRSAAGSNTERIS